jgi:hypothetical protein
MLKFLKEHEDTCSVKTYTASVLPFKILPTGLPHFPTPLLYCANAITEKAKALDFVFVENTTADLV